MASSVPHCDGCGKPAFRDTESGDIIPLKRCSRCRQVYYHNLTCQKEHFKQHRKHCRRKPFIVKEIPGRGRGIVAIDDSLDLLLPSLAPLVLPVLHEDCRRERCVVCFGRASEWLWEHSICPIRVCSQKCRQVGERDWLLAEEIQCLQKLFRQPLSIPKLLPTALLLFRLVLAMEHGIIGKDDVLAMIRHGTAPLSENERAHQQAVIFTLMMLKKPTDDAIELLQRIKYNAFTVVDTNDTPLGVSLYSSPAHLFNHSCRPNAVQSFVFDHHGPPRLQIRRARDIYVNDEICISYHQDEAMSKEERREYLHEQYNFWCDCDQCV